MTSLSTSTPDRVAVGKVGKPFGTNGEVYVFPDVDLAEPFNKGTAYNTDGHGTLTASKSTIRGDRTVVRFDTVNSRNDAEALRGVVLYRDRDQIPLDDGAVWITEIIGRTVRLRDGDPIGTVTDVTDGAAHDYLHVTTPSTTVTVPMVPELVDWDDDPVIVEPLPGLFDQNEAWVAGRDGHDT